MEKSLSLQETESVLLNEIKQSIEECTADEFQMFMVMLGATSLPKTVSGQSMIVELIAHSIHIDKGNFDPNDDEAIDRLVHCSTAALQYFSVSGVKFYVCNS